MPAFKSGGKRFAPFTRHELFTMTALFKSLCVLIYTAIILSVCADENATRQETVGISAMQEKAATGNSMARSGTHGRKIKESFVSLCSEVYAYFKSFFVSDEGETQPTNMPLPSLGVDEKVLTKDQDIYSEKPVCKTCGTRVPSKAHDLPEEDIKVFHIKKALKVLQLQLGLPTEELETEEILRLNRMKKESFLDLPKPLLDQMDSEREVKENKEDNDQHAWLKMEIFTGQQNVKNCKGLRDVKCYKFQLNDAIKPQREIASAKLWVPSRGMKGCPISVYQIKSGLSSVGLQNRSSTVHQEVSVNQKWIQLNMTEALLSWTDGRQGNADLAIQCRCCLFHDHIRGNSEQKSPKPFLSVEFYRNHRERTKRSESLDSNPFCRVRDLYISLALLLRMNINTTGGISLGYCYGTCDETMMTFNHGFYRRRYSSVITDVDMQNVLRPCCAPRVLLSVNMIRSYRNTYSVDRVDNMKVQSCSCL